MPLATDTYRALTQAVSTELASLRISTPGMMKAFGDLGLAYTAEGALDKKTKELIALALSEAVRRNQCMGFHTQALARLGATRQKFDDTLGVAVCMGGGPSLMYAASAIKSFDGFADASKS